MAADLNDSIESFKKQVYESNFDISQYYLPDEEVVKNIIASKSDYTKEDIETMVDGTVVKKVAAEAEATSEAGSSGVSGSSGTSGVSGSSSGTVAKNKVKEAKTKVKGTAAKAYPMPKNVALHQEAKEMKEEVRIASTMLIKEKTSIAQELANVTVLIANSVPAILGLTVTIPVPNIPTAIALACSIISLISKLVDKIQDVLAHLEPLKKLKLLISEDRYKQATAPINLALTALTNLLKPIFVLKDAIQKLLAQITKLVSPSSIESQIKSLKKEKAKKDKEIKKAKDDKESQETITGLENESADISKQIANLQDSNYKSKSDISSVQKSVESALNAVTEANQVTYVYDVKLPDGRILRNQTDADLAQLDKTFKIVYQNG